MQTYFVKGTLFLLSAFENHGMLVTSGVSVIFGQIQFTRTPSFSKNYQNYVKGSFLHIY